MGNKERVNEEHETSRSSSSSLTLPSPTPQPKHRQNNSSLPQDSPVHSSSSSNRTSHGFSPKEDDNQTHHSDLSETVWAKPPTATNMQFPPPLPHRKKPTPPPGDSPVHSPSSDQMSHGFSQKGNKQSHHSDAPEAAPAKPLAAENMQFPPPLPHCKKPPPPPADSSVHFPEGEKNSQNPATSGANSVKPQSPANMQFPPPRSNPQDPSPLFADSPLQSLAFSEGFYTKEFKLSYNPKIPPDAPEKRPSQSTSPPADSPLHSSYTSGTNSPVPDPTKPPLSVVASATASENHWIPEKAIVACKVEPTAENGFASSGGSEEEGRGSFGIGGANGDAIGGWKRESKRYDLSILRRVRRENMVKRALLGLRVCGFVFCLVSFSLMAADRFEGWALDSFYRYKEFRYCISVNVIGFAYSILQAYDAAYLLATSKHLFQHHLWHYLEFAFDQILSYLLISASSSAATRIDDWQSNWGKDKFTEMASISVVFSFMAFAIFALSSLISGYALCTRNSI